MHVSFPAEAGTSPEGYEEACTRNDCALARRATVDRTSGWRLESGASRHHVILPRWLPIHARTRGSAEGLEAWSLGACIYDDSSASMQDVKKDREGLTSNCRDTADVQAQSEVDIIHIFLHSGQWIEHHRGTRLHLEIRLGRQVGVGGVGARLR